MHLLAAFIPVIYMFMFLTHYFIFSRISPFSSESLFPTKEVCEEQQLQQKRLDGEYIIMDHSAETNVLNSTMLKGPYFQFILNPFEVLPRK